MFGINQIIYNIEEITLCQKFDNINWVNVCDSNTDPDNLGCLLEDGNIALIN